MKATFDLTREPWIPCRFLDGQNDKLGLTDLFLKASEIAEVFGETPLEEASLNRFLVAVAHRIVNGPSSESAWTELWEKGSFDRSGVLDYFDSWRDRFDLFHPEHPFYQHPEAKAINEVPPSVIVHFMASGNNAVLFDHHLDAEGDSWEPDAAARRLVAAQNYSLGGLGPSYQGKRVPFCHAPLVRGALAVVLGKNLFETIVMNLVVLGSKTPFRGRGRDEDLPVWEQPLCPFTPSAERVPNGYLDYLTWRSRFILYSSDEEGKVSAVRWIQGFQLVDVGPKDPMMAFQHHPEKQGSGLGEWLPLIFTEGRALWRNSLVLATTLKEEQEAAYKPPETLRALAFREEIPGIPQRPKVRLFGLLADKAKPLLWRREDIPVPLDYLRQESQALTLREALQQAEEVASKALYSAACVCADVLSSSLSKDEKRGARETKNARREVFLTWVRKAVEPFYWAQLEIPFLNLFMNESLESMDRSKQLALLAEWFKRIKQSAWTAFDQIETRLQGVPEGLQAFSEGFQSLRIKLGEIAEKSGIGQGGEVHGNSR